MPTSVYPKLELKYCERCGGLWLRPQGSDTAYCAACAAIVSELPPVVPRGGTSSGTMQAACVSIAALAAAVLALADCLGGLCA